jgi:hypothetical protein
LKAFPKNLLLITAAGCPISFHENLTATYFHAAVLTNAQRSILLKAKAFKYLKEQ